jgi:hypothetical protein
VLPARASVRLEAEKSDVKRLHCEKSCEICQIAAAILFFGFQFDSPELASTAK